MSVDAPAAVDEPQARAAAWLRAVRAGDGEGASREAQALAAVPLADLATALNTDARRKAFWINVYNAVAQRDLIAAPPADGLLAQLRFFRTPRCTVGGRRWSLDAIEHGLLRRSRVWWAAGYLRKPWTGAAERRLRVDTLDPRVHFALNCGAVSCPPIRAYAPERVDEQLDTATAAYLEGAVHVDSASGELRVPGLFRLFRGDFGGRRGILAFLSRHGRYRDPATVRRLRFDPFDRGRRLGHFAPDAFPPRP